MPFLRATDPPKAMLTHPAVFAGSLGLVGFLPRARGTAGSVLCALGALILVLAWDGAPQCWLPLAGFSAALSWWAGACVLKSLPEIKDPGWFVLDEAAGFFLTLGLLAADSPLDIFAGLLTFRFYDIAKPWPVRTFERIPGSLGILMDDLAAGVLAGWTWYTIRALTNSF